MIMLATVTETGAAMVVRIAIRLFAIIVALFISISAIAQIDLNCDTGMLLSSTSLKAPQATELRDGAVIFKFIVTKAGTVEGIELISFEGDNRWVASFKDLLEKAQYVKPTESYTQVCEYRAIASE